MHIGAGDDRLALHRWPGAGPPVLLIHGIGSSGASWNDLVPRLQGHLTPIAIDLRGHGTSGRPASGFLYDDYIADLERIVTTLQLTAPVIMGHSLGGIVALWWAARHPNTARAIVAIDTPLRSGEAFRPAFDNWITWNAMTIDDLVEVYRRQHPEWPPAHTRRRAEIMTGTAPGVFRELREDSLAHEGVDRVAELTGIQSPVLLVRGDPEWGSLVHPADAVSFAHRLPNAMIGHVPEGGHGLHREKMDAFLELALPFIEEHAGSSDR